MLIFLLLLGAFLRLFNLGSTPPPFVDEILNAIDIRSTIRTGRHYTGLPNDILGQITPFLDGRYFIHYSIGDSIGDYRLVSAVFGIATIYVVYLLGKELYDTTVALWAAASLALLPWAIYYSRIAFTASEYVFATSCSLLFLILALRSKSLFLGMSCAASAALSIYVYPVAIVSTPLLLGVVLVMLFKDVFRFPFRRAIAVIAFGVLLLLPYLWAHLSSRGHSATASLNQLVAGRLLWEQGLPLTTQFRTFISNWSSFITPRYLFFSGDPNVRQSIQSMGEVGWSTTLLGLWGIIVCIKRGSVSDRLILLWLVVYPVASSLTFQNAYANSVQGSTGELPWILLAAIGASAIVTTVRTNWRLIALGLTISSLVVQGTIFSIIYFGSYNDRFGYAFEPASEYDQVVSVIRDAGLQNVEITSHSGYLRNLVLEYFSDYKVNVTSWYSSCSPLPYDVINYTPSPRLFVVNEGTSYNGYSNCVSPTSIASSDIHSLQSVGWHLRILADYPNSPGSAYRTVVIFATRSIRATSRS